MPQTNTRSLEQIKRETEQTRAGLTETVEQLKTSVADTASDIRRRISPGAIKAEVTDYIKSRGEQLVSDVTAAARKNPMQAVAVGASLAYPLFRLARSIPVPVLMVGAGLFWPVPRADKLPRKRHPTSPRIFRRTLRSALKSWEIRSRSRRLPRKLMQQTSSIV